MNVKVLLEILGLPENKVKNIYATGSRVYGTSNENSDWDFVMILENESKKELGINGDYIEKGNITSSVVEELEFLKLLSEHHHLAVYCICTPPEFVWKKTTNLSCELCPSKLKSSFMRKVGSLLHKARSTYSKNGEVDKLKKSIVHALRYLLVAQQIMEKNCFCLVDFSVANVYHEKLKNVNSSSWDDYKEYWTFKEELVRKIFPPSIHQENFLDDNEPLPIAQLKRAQNFKAYGGQEKYSILDIIRKNIVDKNEFNKEFPHFISTYDEVEEKYLLLCQLLQRRYDEIRKDTKDDWHDHDLSIKAIQRDGGMWKALLFAMRNQNVESAQELFKFDIQLKSLHTFMFHSKKGLILPLKQSKT